jgi:putative ABC transport system substrate-binding protein
VAVLRDPAVTSGIGQFGAIPAVASSVEVEVSPINFHDPDEIERGINALAGVPNCGLIVSGTALAVVHRELIITLAARHKLPAVYFERFFVISDGLISFGPDIVDQYRRAASYVVAFSRARSPRIFRCRRRPNTS